MQREEMVERTKKFALRIIRLNSKLPKTDVGRGIGRQLLRSGTSIGANYREAARSGTKKHFTSILTIALREADETLYWLDLLAESGTMKPELLADLVDEWAPTSRHPLRQRKNRPQITRTIAVPHI